MELLLILINLFVIFTLVLCQTPVVQPDRVPDPAPYPKHYPTGIVLDWFLKKLCPRAKNKEICISLQSSFIDWCAQDPAWCDDETQDRETFVSLCPTNKKYCAKKYIQKIEHKLQMTIMYNEYDKICLYDGWSMCSYFNVIYANNCRKDKRWCSDDTQMISKYIELCTMWPKYCTKDTVKYAKRKYAEIFP